MKTKYIIMLAVVTVVIFLLLVIFLLFNTNIGKTPASNELPTQSYPPGYNEAQQGVSVGKQDEQENEQSYKVGQLIKLLPYKGQYFSFTYSFSSNVFTLAVDSKNEGLGNENFLNFLSEHGVQKSWIDNLRTTTQ